MWLCKPHSPVLVHFGDQKCWQFIIQSQKLSTVFMHQLLHFWKWGMLIIITRLDIVDLAAIRSWTMFVGLKDDCHASMDFSVTTQSISTHEYSSVHISKCDWYTATKKMTRQCSQDRHKCYKFSLVQVLIVFHASVNSSTGTHKPYWWVFMLMHITHITQGCPSPV